MNTWYLLHIRQSRKLSVTVLSPHTALNVPQITCPPQKISNVQVGHGIECMVLLTALRKAYILLEVC